MKFTLAICCYNFERFIDEAIDGAFAQTYRPLEIVISDDHSPDRSWERILSNLVRRGYDVPSSDAVGTFTLQGQDLTVILNRNPQNLGLALHENKLFELSSGDYIAFQAGDDISMPERIAKIAEAVKADPNIRCLHSHAEAIDACGNKLKVPDSFRKEEQKIEVNRNELPYILGAVAVYHRDVYAKFGPLGPHVGNEDHVLPFRASFIGTIRLLDGRLVKYRKHGDNASGSYSRDPVAIARFRLRMMFMYYQELTDLHYAESINLVGFKAACRCRSLIKDQLFIMYFLGSWHLHPEVRGRLLWQLITTPRKLGLFAARFLGRICMKFI